MVRVAQNIILLNIGQDFLYLLGKKTQRSAFKTTSKSSL